MLKSNKILNRSFHFFCFLLIIIFNISFTKAQKCDTLLPPKANNTWVIENNFYFGKIVKNYPVFPPLDWTYLNEFNMSLQTRGQKYWHRFYYYPQIGVAALYGSTGNPSVIGTTFSLYPTFTIALKNYSKTSWHMRMGLGAAYFTNKFHPLRNSENLLIGSSVTGTAMASLNYKRMVNAKNAVLLGVSSFHYSNGHYQIPNVGINIIAISAGWQYSTHSKIVKEQKVNIDVSKKLSYNLQGGFGVHEFSGTVSATGGAKYPVYCGGVFISKRFSPINNVQAGLFVNYHTGFYDYITSHDFYTTRLSQHAYTGVFFLGHEFIIGRFAFVTQGGLYLYNPFKKDFLKQQLRKKLTAKNYLDLVNTNKLGFKYYYKKMELGKIKGLYSGIYIKANFGQADFIEFSSGFAF